MRYRGKLSLQKKHIQKSLGIKFAKNKSFLRRAEAKTGVHVLFSLLGVVTGITSVFVLGIIALLMGYIGIINASLPDVGKIVLQDLEQSTKIYDRNDKLLYTVYSDINREYVSLNRIPDHTKWALLAAEDIDFYHHKGFDIPGIISASLDALASKDMRGASTVTQQLSRNVVLKKLVGEKAASERTLQRKLLEILVASQLEHKLTKDQILELQMNEVFLGGTSFGYQTAARAYFNKDVKDLSLSESAFLAGIIQSPTFYMNALNSGDEVLVVKRRNDILDLMLRHKDKTGVNEEQIRKAKAEKLIITPGQINLTAPHFVFYVIEQLEAKYGPEVIRSGGLKVKTTLDLDTQSIAERRLRDAIWRFRTWYGVHNGAVVIINPKNGEVLAMVGSVDYNNTSDKRVDGNVNVAVMPRQMGSSVKPYTYMAAFRDGYNPGSLASDIPTSFGSYKPLNWDKKFQGVMSMRTALNRSRNVPAVRTLNMIGGPSRFIAEAERLGITTLKERNRYGLSLTLGAGDMRLIEHTNAFGAFANRGVKYDPAVILEVKSNKGEVIYKYDSKTTEKRVYSEDEAFLMNWVLCQMGGRLDKGAAHMYKAQGQTLCGKTGTTNGPKDLVTIGYYPRLVVGVWTGNNNGQLTFGTRGQGWSENVPIVIMRDIMSDLIPKYGREFYSQPRGVASGWVCKSTGILTTKDSTCAKETTVYIKGRTQLPRTKVFIRKR
jgi:membrane peptidoglycan carboxypeptidase